VADITGVWTWEGWLYLAVVLDIFSRMVVGWAIDQRRDEALVEQAARMALSRLHPESGLLHHSDRGSQYTAADYRALLARCGIIVSMSRKADCYDNALMESFIGTFNCSTKAGQGQYHRACSSSLSAHIRTYELLNASSPLPGMIGYI
jgi:putative transposase